MNDIPHVRTIPRSRSGAGLLDPEQLLSHVASGRGWWLWLVIRIYGVLTLSVHGLVNRDLDLYAGWARRWAGGELPYANFNLEYPPGMLPFLLLPSETNLAYSAAFVASALFADALLFLLLRRDGASLGAGLWLLLPLLLGPVTWCRTDIFVALALVGGVIAARRPAPGAAALCFVAAAALKLWPVVLIALVLPLLAPGLRLRFLLWSAVSGSALLVTVTSIFGLGGLHWMLNYHADRGLQVETLAAVPLHAARLAGADLKVGLGYGSLEFPAASMEALLLLLTLSLLLGLLRCAALALRSRTRGSNDLALLVLGTTLVIAATGKVLSAQYAIWIVAAVAISIDRLERRVAIAAAAAAYLITTQYVFPFTFAQIVEGTPLALMAAIAHGCALAWLCWLGLSAIGFWRFDRTRLGTSTAGQQEPLRLDRALQSALPIH